MKHLKTFESYIESLNENINSKAKDLMSKFDDCILVSDWYADSKDEGFDTENADKAMKAFGTKPENTLYASAANDEDDYEEFLELVKKSGLKYQEAENVDGFSEVFVSGK